MLTWEKTQLILKLDNEDRTIVEELIPMVEQDYLRIRNKPYDMGIALTVTSGATTDGDLEVDIDCGKFLVPVKAGNNALVVAGKIEQYVGRYFNARQDGTTVYLYGFIDVTFDPMLTGVTASVSDLDTIYPIGFETVAIKMIQWHKDRINQTGIKSESLGDYSVTFADVHNDYPKSIIGSIRRYATWV